MAGYIKLSRDCPAMLIPSGVKVLLMGGCEVIITHKLAGTFTVLGNFGMARIDGENADALGLESPKADNPAGAAKLSACATASQIADERKTPAEQPGHVSEDDAWEVAKTVYDPEIPVNIVDLGLVYRLEVFDDGGGKRRVEADMTLTAPGCSMGPAIAEDLRCRIEALPSVSEAKVNIVWDPPWNKDMMSEEARMILGLA